MAKKPDPQPEPVVPNCPACNGTRGRWDYGNGSGIPKQWIGCKVCKGTGKAS